MAPGTWAQLRTPADTVINEAEGPLGVESGEQHRPGRAPLPMGVGRLPLTGD